MTKPWFSGLLLFGTLLAQAPAAKPVQAHAGCVTALPDDARSFVLAEGDSCSLLTGKLASKQLAGHQVQVLGLMQDATATEPQTLVIDSVSSVGAVCSQTCTLAPPGQRGLRRKPKAGTQGGTPGV